MTRATEQAPAAWLAAVCDRGSVHHTNEDAFAVTATAASDGHGVLVVCDGVSSAPNSATAATTASSLVADALTEPSSHDVAATRLLEAVARANQAVSELAGGVDHPPSCTLAAAVVNDRAITACWVGDSRVYWLPDDAAAELLTTDDSMAQLRIEWGVARTAAESGPGAHTITRWLGRGASTDPAHILTREVTTGGWALVCSDGLWNYASTPTALAEVVGEALADRDPPTAIELARWLVNWANEQGGADNITVAAARLNGPAH